MLPSKKFTFVIIGVAVSVGGAVFLFMGLDADSVPYSRDGFSAVARGGADELGGPNISGDRPESSSKESSEEDQEVRGHSTASTDSDKTAESTEISQQSQNMTDHYPEDSWTREFLEYYNQTVDEPLINYSDISEFDRSKALRGFLERADVKNELRRFRAYTQKDLTINDKVADEDRRDYGNKVAQIFIDNSSPYNVTSLSIYRKAREIDDGGLREELINELRNTRLRYERMQNELVQLNVPEDAVEVHLALLNSSSLLEKRVAGMTLFSLDPIRGVVNAGAYKPQSKYFVESYEQLVAYLEEHEVSFAQGEPGSTL
ncbi:MAG: hypothetical protein WDZ82_03390 [Candidatus Paceibacterota bacterium]